VTAAVAKKRLVLDDALASALLLLRADDARASRAAARAVGRYALERPRVDLAELALLVESPRLRSSNELPAASGAAGSPAD
jgi:hypothetical protein